MNGNERDRLAEVICRAWSRATAQNPVSWTPASPSRGQCAVTALVVQDYCGGDLVRAIVAGESHYWNRMPDGEECDWTASQFDTAGYEAWVSSDDRPVVRDRAYVLSSPDTARRYRLLKAAVDEALAGRGA